MGIGKIGRPNLTFVRQFRFLLEGDHLENWFHHSLNVLWHKNTIQLWSYEVLDNGIIPIHEWVKDMQNNKYPDESLTLITLDGMGNEIYRKKFHNLKIHHQENRFNYEKNDVVTYYMEIHYEKITDETPLKNQIDVKDIKKTNDITFVHHLNSKFGIK
jgi:hypothetical protein